MTLHRARSHNPKLYGNARRLRREMTPAEVILWTLVRNHRLTGFKFRRQQPVGPYIADFFCPAAKLIVELDGDSHTGREEEDATRQVNLEVLGYRVIRFGNPQVYDESDAVIEAIWRACMERIMNQNQPANPVETPLPLRERVVVERSEQTG